MKNNKHISILLIILILFTSLIFLPACSYKTNNYPDSLYNIRLSLDTESHTLTGSAEITYYSRAKKLSELSLQIYANAYQSEVVNEQYIEYAYPDSELSFGGIEIANITSSTHGILSYKLCGEDNTTLRIKLKKGLARKEKITFTVDYTITLPNIKHRLGYTDYVYNIANFYPIMCIYENGGFTEYNYSKLGDPFYSEIANYNVNFTFPKNFIVAHTGSEVTRIENNNDTITLKLSAEKVRDFAICASPYFIVRTIPLGNVTIKYYYINEDNADSRLNHIKSVMEAFSNYYTDYPYNTLSVVKTPFAFGGMEYPQLVYISDTLSGEESEMVITHELAHQWWYGLVGNDQIKHPWLDESLAEFSTLYYYRQQNAVKYESYFKNYYDKYIRYASITGLTGDNAVMDDCLYDYDDYRYSANVYTKGMLMYMSLYEIKGEKLISALSDYAKAYAYKTATPELLITSLSLSLKSPQQAYFDAWLKGKVILL